MPKVPPRGRPIQKGERRNPKGSSAKARGIAAMKKAHKTMSPDELANLMSLFMNGTPEQLMAARNDEKASVLTKLVAKFLTTAHDKADMQIFRTLLEFTVGRPRERKSHEVSGPDGGPIPTAQQSDEEMLAEIKRLRAAREAADKAGG